MCENYPMTQKKSEDTIVHEMIHAYDHCKNFFDKNNCVHIACSEVRVILSMIVVLYPLCNIIGFLLTDELDPGAKFERGM